MLPWMDPVPPLPPGTPSGPFPSWLPLPPSVQFGSVESVGKPPAPSPPFPLPPPIPLPRSSLLSTSKPMDWLALWTSGTFLNAKWNSGDTHNGSKSGASCAIFVSYRALKPASQLPPPWARDSLRSGGYCFNLHVLQGIKHFCAENPFRTPKIHPPFLGMNPLLLTRSAAIPYFALLQKVRWLSYTSDPPEFYNGCTSF